MRWRAGLGATLMLGMSACATTPGGDEVAQRDPLEGYNRAMYGINRGLDRAVLRPAAQGYQAVVPVAGQRGVTNFFNNVDEPLTFVNALLQGKPGRALNALGRFVINTVLGVGGLADHATDMGLPPQEEDFGQTLAVWGVNSGPFIVLPLFGPSTFRDATGLGIEIAGGDPYRLGRRELDLSDLESYSLTGVELLDTRSQLMTTADALLQGSADEYATVRAAYLQLRRSEVYDGAEPEEEFSPPPAMGPPADAGALTVEPPEPPPPVPSAGAPGLAPTVGPAPPGPAPDVVGEDVEADPATQADAPPQR